MNQETENLSGNQSLEIITAMINTAKGDIGQSSFHFLLWGWVILIANLGHYLLQEVAHYEAPFLVWLITIPAAIASFIYGYRRGRSAKVQSHFSRIYVYTWLAFAISLVIALVFLASEERQYILNPMILILAAFATFITGISLKFKPLIIGSILFWIFAIVSLIIYNPYQYLISALAVLTGYLIPGYMIRKKNQ